MLHDAGDADRLLSGSDRIRWWSHPPPWSYPALLALVVTLITVPFLPFAFAYEDVGLNAIKGWVIVEHPGAALWELSWLSSMVAGVWMAMTDYSLIALRFGFLLWAVATVLVTYAILRLYYPPRACIAPILLTYLVSIFALEQLILSYYTVPVLFGLLVIYSWLRSLRTADPTHVLVWSLCCGISFALLIQSRYPSVMLGVLLAAAPILERWKYGGWNGTGRRLIGIVSGTIVGSGIILLALHLSGYLTAMIEGITEIMFAVSSSNDPDNIHHPARMVVDTAIRYAKVILIGGLGVVLATAWRRVIPERAPWVRVVRIVLLLLVALLTFIGSYLGLVTTPPPIGMAIWLFAIVVVLTYRALPRETFPLYLAAAFFFVMMNLGASNHNPGSFKYYLWLLLPIAWIESSRLRPTWISLPILRGLIAVNIIAAMLTTRLFENKVFIGSVEPFRAIPTLEHIRWNHARAFDEMVGEVRKAGVREGDTILTYVEMPMLHFATLTIPMLRNPWVSDMAVGYPTLERTREIVDEAIAHGRAPKVVLRRLHTLFPSTKKTRYLDSLWGALRYDTVWREGEYLLLKRRSLP